jgi:hypothetical protein
VTTPSSANSSGRSGNGSGSAQPVHLLVLAGETLAAPAVLDRIRDVVGDRPASAWVVAPALTSSGIKHAAGEVDDAIENARRRLEESERALRDAGIEAQGEVGDSDPSMALEDALRRVEVDQILIAARAGDGQRWLETDALNKSARELGRPVTHIVIDSPSPDEGSVRVEQPPPGAGRAPDVQPGGDAYDLPPMPPRYWLAIAVGVVGTIALGVLSLLCQNDAHGRDLPVPCAFLWGLTILSFMVTVWHSVGLLLFGAAGYRGRWGRVTADLMLYGVPPAVLAGAVLYIIA